jgi:hypothetical protein
LLSLSAQVTLPTLTNPTPSDARSNQFEDVRGATWKVFAVESFPDGPLGIGEVQEVRQQNPPSSWVVFVRNRSLMPVASYNVAAAIVAGDGAVKGIQPLPTIKNLQPSKMSRQEMRVRVNVLMPTDRVVFFVQDVNSELGTWKANHADVSSLIKAAVKRLPAP